MKVLVTGSTGAIGRSLVPALTADGHEVVRLVRRRTDAPDEVFWRPDEGEIDSAALEGIDAAVHLAGERILGRWTSRKKARILESRAAGTRLLSGALARLERPPSVLVSSSAVGYYPARGDEPLTEESPSGDGFLAEVCREWEAGTAPAVEKGIRVIILRNAIVMTRKGPPLSMMLLPFRLGLGGAIGSGEQYFPWVSEDDTIGSIQHALETPSLSGPVNVAAPHQVTMRELAKTLGRVLRRPAILKVPSFVVKLIAGEMADEMLLASQRVESRRLMASGYRFRYPELEGALRHALGRD
jgi:uncharacterized protein (TIGR01777 family)